MIKLQLPNLRRWLRRGLALLLSVAITATIGIYSPGVAKDRTEILWDTNGVPHVYSADAEGLFYAFGWAQMQSHADLLLRLYGQARGQAAEYWGEDYRESDLWVRTVGVPERAAEWYTAQSPDFRNNLDAFATGINAYAETHPDTIDPSLSVVLPITAVDVLAHGQRILQFTFVTNPGEIEDLVSDASEDTAQSTARSLAPKHQPGSNAWAIAPEHSENGHAMLLANPHLFWSDMFRWYEAHLSAPGINAYGATLVGIPVLTIAFNDQLGWTNTVNTYDGWDAYQLDLVDDGYRWEGGIRDFEVTQQVLKVKQSDGTLRTELLLLKRSVHGPVVKETDGKAIALRVAGLDRASALEEWWNMARATNLNEFESALRQLQIPMFTVMYADREGHIMHLFNGQVPVRSQGDFSDWSEVRAGDTAETLWTELHPYEDLPRVVDPASGWLQNANDSPWTTTFPTAISSADYPAYMAPAGPMALRAQRSAQMLMQDDKIEFSELIEYKHSTQMLLAARLLDDLLPIADQQGSEQVQQAVSVLRQWDLQTNADSRGAVLFVRWAETMGFSDLFALPWDAAQPLSTPDGLANPDKAIAVLEQAAAEIQATYGRLDVAWGEVFRFQTEDVNLPANGADEPLGVFRTVWFEPTEDDQFTANGGDSYVAAIEFSDPLQAKVSMSYVNATQDQAIPGVKDQSSQQLSQQTLRPAWRSRADIEAHLAFREAFNDTPEAPN
ncbi:MAG: acylase [Leptolyngbya foveolarum]|uniref:Acylase n=1 Tax=Leptolyngbya foveolarum TaxID=47253 RepID=A0A2W4VV01_9CYAN|nr:MAG: acylase [Leptolyngbya foveolarum]